MKAGAVPQEAALFSARPEGVSSRQRPILGPQPLSLHSCSRWPQSAGLGEGEGAQARLPWRGGEGALPEASGPDSVVQAHLASRGPDKPSCGRARPVAVGQGQAAAGAHAQRASSRMPAVRRSGKRCERLLLTPTQGQRPLCC